MTNALKLVRTTDTLAAAPARQKHPRSPRQQEVTANLSLISRTWRTLTDSQRESFVALGRTWSPTPGKTTAKGLVVFQAINGVRLNSGQGNILTDAPSQPPFIGKLPAYTLNATITAPPAASLSLSDDPAADAPSATGSFTLQFISKAFAGPVLVLASRPLSAGVTQPSPKDMRQIALLPAIDTFETDITAAYTSQFMPPALGMKIAIQLVPVTPDGFRGNPFTQIGTVLAV